MRLLHTKKLEVVTFMESQSTQLKYAILSHTWEDEEVTFQDMQDPLYLPTQKQGFSKLEKSCELAHQQGYQYIWIDTCCIDKTSSAELSEAINSMYRWYEEADICYSYLADVPSRSPEELAHKPSSLSEKVAMDTSLLQTSRWFTRGWTLQELIAPKRLLFLSKSWDELGRREDLSMAISKITGIDGKIFGSRSELNKVSAAQKMFWASKRVTTRLEDRAYSLMGLFDVNMPLLYGEGEKAFIRLQESILKVTDDESLFVHRTSSNEYAYHSSSLLADSPDCFSDSGEMLIYHGDERLKTNLDAATYPSFVTNKGVQVNLLGYPCLYRKFGFGQFHTERARVEHKGWLALLNCRVSDDVFARPAIFLKLLELESDRYMRLDSRVLLLLRGTKEDITIDHWRRTPRGEGNVTYVPELDKLQRRTIYVGDERLRELPFNRPLVWVMKIRQPSDTKFIPVQGWPKWNAEQRTLCDSSDQRDSAISVLPGALLFQDSNRNMRFIIVLRLMTHNSLSNEQLPAGSQWRYNAWCTLVEISPDAADSHSLIEIIKVVEGKQLQIHPPRLADHGSEAMLAIDNKYLIRATLALEEFLERREFTISVEVRTNKEEDWKSLRERRMEIFRAGAKSGLDDSLLGYVTKLELE